MTNKRFWVGVALVVLSAVSFAANSTSAVVSYHAGATPMSVITFRLILTIAGLYAFLRLTGVPIRLPPRARNLSLALGIGLGAQSYLLFAAIEILPVALGILTFYLYPLMIGIGAAATGQERLNRGLVIALVIAFAGLALALDVTGGGLDTTGIVFAALSAASFAVVAVACTPLIHAHGDSRPITLHMHVTAAAGFVVISLIAGDFPLPATTTGWAAFVAVPVFYTVAITAFFAAVAIIGSVRTSLIMNIEPLTSIVFGFVILGQALTPIQLAGAALVLGAIMAVRFEGGRRATEP